MIRVATAFSGGLAAPEFALKYSGIEHEIVFACEWDKYARRQYLQFHGKPTTFYEDIKNLCAKCYYALIDLFVFGSPCQNLSLAGNQQGLEGEKSKYFFEGYRILSEMMPKVFIFENVKGLLSSNKGKDFALVMKMFRDLGYHCAHTVLNTKDYGVPQNRERVFVVGFLDVNAYHAFNFLPGFPLEKRLRDVLESEVDEKYYLSDKLIKTFLEKSNDPKSKMTIQAFHNKDDAYSAFLTAQYQKSRITDPYIKEPIKIGYINQDTQSSTVYSSDGIAMTLCAGTHGYALGYVLDIDRINRALRVGGGNSTTNKHCFDLVAIKNEPKILVNSANNQGFEEALIGDSINIKNLKSKTRRGRVGKQIVNTLECNNQQVVIEPMIQQKSQSGVRLREDCGTLSASGNRNDMCVIDGYRIRRLTPRECFRLQGVRDEDINIVVSDTQAYKIAGNAMSVPPLEMLITQIFRPQRIASLFSA